MPTIVDEELNESGVPQQHEKVVEFVSKPQYVDAQSKQPTFGVKPIISKKAEVVVKFDPRHSDDQTK